MNMWSINKEKQRSILIVNPNTTKSMTDALKPLVDSLRYDQTHFEYFTAPSGVPSINDEDGAAVSADACVPALRERLKEFDAFLVCCYSQHPLVPRLRAELKKVSSGDRRPKPVTGIFDASVATCLLSIDMDEKFAIVSTGKYWEDHLRDAVGSLLGSKTSDRYVGAETTGLNANELHTTPKNDVDQRMKDATKRALGNGAKAICLGCAGMAGMDHTVREACIEQLGEKAGQAIKIVDGVVSGVIFLEGALRAGY